MFTDATRVIFQQTNWLGFLCVISADIESRPPSLLSWVMNPRQDPSCIFACENASLNAPGRFLSSPALPAPDLRVTDSLLRTHGTRIAKIDGKSEPLGDVLLHKVDFEAGAELFLDQPQRYQYTNETLIDVLWRTLIVDRTNNVPMTQWRHSFKNWWFDLLLARTYMASREGKPVAEHLQTVPKILLLAQQDESGTLASHDDVVRAMEDIQNGNPILKLIGKEMQMYALNVIDWAPGHCVFRTAEGYFGLGPNSLEINDEVWIMPRAPVALILRKSSRNDSQLRYKFIGERYVHGIMHGEYFEHRDSKWEEVELE